MFRVLNLVSILALLAAAGAVYNVKYAATSEAQRIAKLRSEIRQERDRIAMLNAEWARRTAPDRVQALAERHLDMQPLGVDSMDTLANLPAKPAANDDVLGGMIEALVDGPMTTSSLPRDKAPARATPGAAPAAAAPRPAPSAMAPPAPRREAPVAIANPLPPAAVPAAPPAPRGPLPLYAMPPAGVMGGAPAVPGAAVPQGRALMTAPVTSTAPMLPPGAVGQ
ncbi:cell division protein FtsL [Ancylobacter terrae]|uniref:cell division protein FtsL n=1 Tax=Ancylobacter sp. sgz301288 TaxID=3342077 RepID=UPI00385E3390